MLSTTTISYLCPLNDMVVVGIGGLTVTIHHCRNVNGNERENEDLTTIMKALDNGGGRSFEGTTQSVSAISFNVCPNFNFFF